MIGWLVVKETTDVDDWTMQFLPGALYRVQGHLVTLHDHVMGLLVLPPGHGNSRVQYTCMETLVYNIHAWKLSCTIYMHGNSRVQYTCMETTVTWVGK